MTLDYLTEELCTKRLDDIINHLWMRLLSREIFITERMDMHLVWTEGRIFLNPIPRLLLDPRFWSDFLPCKCTTSSAYTGITLTSTSTPFSHPNPKDCPKTLIRRSALGFLHSYIALISHETDFHIAQSHHLLPAEISSFLQWKQFVGELLSSYTSPGNQTTIYQHMTPRFRYGELRLSRLNKIYAISRLQSRGYMYRWNRYGEFIRHNLTLLAGVTGYIAIILAAPQVGLSTGSLAEDQTFQAFSRGFTIFSLVGPACVVLLLISYVSFRITANWLSARRFARERLVRMGIESTTQN